MTDMKRPLAFILLTMSLAPLTAAEPPPARVVEVAVKPGAKWTSYPTRALADLPHADAIPPDAGLSQYGGLASRREKATGFFHTTKVDGRWWLVDYFDHTTRRTVP